MDNNIEFEFITEICSLLWEY
ncbi:MAG: hypothetical protein ACD_4C00138G0023, partial [uncultured bacterium (gcode 4)]